MNLQQIRAAVNTYVHRTDPQTIANEPNAIAFAQAEISRSFFPRETYEIEPVTLVAGVGPLPADYGQADAVLTAQGDLAYKSPREFAMLLIDRAARGFYTVTGSDILTDPSLTSLMLNYYRRPEDLVVDSDTSWLSIYFPDVLTWFAIAEQQRFVQDWDQASVAAGHGGEVIARALEASKRVEHSGGRLNMRSN
jgi:hypothetical protein